MDPADMPKPIEPKPAKNHYTRWIFGIAMLGIMGLIFAYTHRPAGPEAQSGKGKKPPTPVVLTPVKTQTVPVELKTIGNVESISSVTLKPQIDGVITSVQFREGEHVRKGQLMFTINTQPIEAAVDQAEATVAKDQAMVAQARAQLVKDQAQVRQASAALKRDQAQLVFAQSQEKRYASLLSQQFISLSEYEQTLASSRSASQTVQADRAALQNARAILEADQAAIRSAQATVRADQAVVESNRIKLAYCYIRAPFSGRTGSLKVHVGDTVQTNTTAMVVLDQINPIYVGFSIPEQNLASVWAHGKAQRYPVSVNTRETPPSTLTGTLNFMENTVDTNTGTLRLRAIFQNNHQLWPGQFVDVYLQLAQEPNAVVIPSQAVQSGQKGDYVFVAEDGKAKIQAVIVDRVVSDMAVIRNGLKVGDKVVTDGQAQLTPGAPIRAVTPSGQKIGASPSATSPGATSGESSHTTRIQVTTTQSSSRESNTAPLTNPSGGR
jgi:multidrug efflux system membrane fusion protein